MLEYFSCIASSGCLSVDHMPFFDAALTFISGMISALISLPSCRFQKVLYRIIAVDYHFPVRSPHGVVSDACKDLMRRIFVADPTKRITIPEIQAHPWYQQDLPPGLTGFNDICLAQQGQSGAPLSAQTEEQIKATVQEAKVVRFSNSDQPVFHDDQDTDYIDDVMDQEYSYTACEF